MQAGVGVADVRPIEPAPSLALALEHRRDRRSEAGILTAGARTRQSVLAWNLF
jgi:hypothetical protein